MSGWRARPRIYSPARAEVFQEDRIVGDALGGRSMAAHRRPQVWRSGEHSGIRRLPWGENVVVYSLDEVGHAQPQPGERGRHDRRTARRARQAGRRCSRDDYKNDLCGEDGAQAKIVVVAQRRDQNP
jgi:hypothetical protein